MSWLQNHFFQCKLWLKLRWDEAIFCLNQNICIFSLPSSSMSLGSGLAGFVSGFGSISPGLSLRGSSAASSPSSFFWAWSLEQVDKNINQLVSTDTLFASDECHKYPIAYSKYSYLSRHWAAVLPMIGAIVRHCVGINLARCSSFSSSSRLHSVFFILGSSHSNQRALHCLADFLCSRDAIRLHWFLPYFITAAFKISS